MKRIALALAVTLLMAGCAAPKPPPTAKFQPRPHKQIVRWQGVGTGAKPTNHPGGLQSLTGSL